MEGSTVSPPPASPTEGDDPCGIDVSSVAMHSVTLLTCLCGLAGNGAVLRLIGMNDITELIFDLAVGDFLFLFFALPSALLFLLEDVSCSTTVPLVYLSLLFLLSLLSYHWGLYGLTFISIARCGSIDRPLWCHCRLPRRLLELVISALYWASFAVIVGNPTLASLCLSQERKHCQVAFISMYAVSLLLFAASMVISSTTLFINVKSGSQQQQRKRLDSVILLTVLFALPPILWNFLEQLGYTVMFSQVVFLLACINSTVKPFIYFSVGSSWMPCSMRSFWRHCSMESLRKSLKGVFEEPEENTPSGNDATMDTAV